MNGGPNRRDVLAGLGATAMLAVLSPWTRVLAQTPDAVRFSGTAAQGGLMIGQADPGSEVRVGAQQVRSADGMFCFGFGRDADKPVEIRIRAADGREESRTVTPQKRNFIIQRIDGLPEKYVSPPQDVLDRIRRDAQAVAEVRNQDSDALWFAEKFDWPADGPISSIYGSQRILNGEPRAPHYGVDIAAPAGTPIRAPVPGIVTLAEDLYLSGNTMIVDHGHGVSTCYLHMSRMDAKPGERLERGAPLGLIGQTGRATGPHLCWRLNWFQTRLDVALLVPPRPGDRV
jgi:murein DD-endopeptidase MepM/ murein hydrolase activator NlpD